MVMEARSETPKPVISFRISSPAPGPTFEAARHIPIHVQWINNLTGPQPLAVDPTIHWANPNDMEMPMPPFPPFPPGFPLAQSPVPIVTHLHGGETEPPSDGYPEAWFTAGEAITGPDFVKSRYHYANDQESATLWYHDHTHGHDPPECLYGSGRFLFDTRSPQPLGREAIRSAARQI